MKVLVIEDDRNIINAIKIAFEFRWPEVALIDSTIGSKAVNLVKQEEPDIIILDLNLPDVSGFDVLKDIRQFSSVPVIILTVRSEDEDMVKGLEFGADDYIIKPFNYMNLLARIKAVLRRAETVPFAGEHDNVVGKRLKIDYVNQKVKVDNRPIILTPIEYHLLVLLVKNHDKVVSYNRIMEEAWGKEYTGSNENIRISVRRLRDKLQDTPPSLIINKRGLGYMFKG